jgi:nudix-type nucleoside diphosphatase (YffH/AdpP family)
MRKVIVHAKHRVLEDFFTVDAAEVSFELYGGGMSRPARRLSLERGDSVAAVVFNRDSRRLIFVEQFKYPTYAHGPGWIVETVAGVLDPGDGSPELALRRELHEELGYGSAAVEPIATFYTSPGGSSERIHLFYAEVGDADRVDAGGGLASEDEDIRAVEVAIDELEGLQIQDAKTLVGVQWFQRRISEG